MRKQKRTEKVDLEQLVTSLKMSEKLKKAGFGIDTCFKKFQELYLVGYPGEREDDIEYNESMCDAAAEAILWCIKNKYIVVP